MTVQLFYHYSKLFLVPRSLGSYSKLPCLVNPDPYDGWGWLVRQLSAVTGVNFMSLGARAASRLHCKFVLRLLVAPCRQHHL